MQKDICQSLDIYLFFTYTLVIYFQFKGGLAMFNFNNVVKFENKRFDVFSIEE